MTREGPDAAGRPRGKLVHIIQLAGVAAAYVVAAKIGFRAAFVAEQVSPVWPPTGIAIWAALRFGPGAVPAIWIAALVTNATTHVPFLAACGIATGNTLEAVVGVWLLRRFGGVGRSVDGLRQVTVLVAATAIGSTMVSASLGVTVLCLSGLQIWSRFAELWWIWWLGDATGALLVAPLLVAAPFWRTRTGTARLEEFVTLETIAIAVSVLVFAVRATSFTGHHPLEYIVFPLVIWAGLRFGQSGAALVGGTVSAIAVWGTLRGIGPFGGASAAESVLLLQLYTAVMAMSALVLGAAIDDRNRAQKRVVESEALNTAIIAAALDCVVCVDAEGRIIEFNPAAVRTFGFTRDQVIGRELAEVLVPVRLRDEHRTAFRRSVGTGAATLLGRRLEMPALRADGAELTVELALTRVGEPARPVFTGHLRDITDRKRAEEDRAGLLARERAARADAEQANRAKDQFLATVSHELRTPLTAILGWTSMLRAREFEPERLGQIHESLYRNAEMQAQIVNDLLDVSRIVMGQLRLELQPVDACEIARLSLETIRPTAIAKGIRLESAIPLAACIVSADPARLQQVVWNLLSNAIKFTPAGGSVSLLVRPGANVAITVADTGVGLSADSLTRVFERFWQADSTATRAQGGLGLGLALVRHLVEIHGGSVEAASEGEQRGSTFTVMLPMRAQEPRESSRQISAPSLKTLHPMKAIVVDDDRSTRELFAAILEGHGAQVVTAASAAEAFGLIESEQPHFLIIDIGMPGEDGLTLLQRIRSDEAFRGRRPAPAIAVTAFAGTVHRDAALRAGFAAHLPKPVLPDEMIAAIVEAVSASH